MSYGYNRNWLAATLVSRVNPTVWRSSRGAAIGLAWPWVALAALSATVVLVRGQRSFWIPALLCLGVAFVLSAWARSHYLLMDHERIEYRTLLKSKASITLDRIQAIEYQEGSRGYRDRFRPLARLMVFPQATSGHPPIQINLNVFARQDVADILQRMSEISHHSGGTDPP